MNIYRPSLIPTFEDRLKHSYFVGNPFISFPSVAGGFSDDTGLVAYFKFDESSGDIINVSESVDDLGAGADLTPDSVTYTQTALASNLNNSVLVNTWIGGVASGYTGYNFMHNTTHEFSLCWWGARTSFDSVSATVFGNCGEWGSGETGFSCRYSATDGTFSLNWSNGTNMNRWRPEFTGLTQDSNPHFFCITAKQDEATNNCEMWEDGSSLGTADNDTYVFSDSNPTSEQVIGANDAGAGHGTQYNGRIGEMSIWDRRLTNSEIAELYNSGAGLQIY